MAKRITVVVSEAQRDLLQEIANDIVAGLNGKFYEIDGTPTATVKYEAGNFKKKPLMAGWEFAVEYGYVGASGQLLFGLTPEDAQEYKWIEMNVKDLDTYFPLMGGEVAKLFGLEGENLKSVIDEVVIKWVEEIEASEAKAKIEAEQNYGALPTFGMF